MNVFEAQSVEQADNTDIALECVTKFGFTATYQALKGLPYQFQNNVLALIPMTESSLNFVKRIKYIVVVDEQTGLSQGPFPKDKVKLSGG